MNGEDLYCLLSVHGNVHVGMCVAMGRHMSTILLLLDGPTHPSSPPKPAYLSKAQIAVFDSSSKRLFSLSTTIPKNVNKPSLGHLGHTFSENPLVGGADSVH